jgi:hypothetical protein
MVAAFVLATGAGLGLSCHAADKPDPNPADPIAVLQGKWYATREKVTVEVKGNEIVVLENTSKKSWPNHAKLKPGLVIGRLGPHKFEYGKVMFSGECWTMGGGRPDFNLQPCTETASAYLETRGKKPYWTLYTTSLSLVRENQLKEWLSSRE